MSKRKSPDGAHPVTTEERLAFLEKVNEWKKKTAAVVIVKNVIDEMIKRSPRLQAEWHRETNGEEARLEKAKKLDEKLKSGDPAILQELEEKHEKARRKRENRKMRKRTAKLRIAQEEAGIPPVSTDPKGRNVYMSQTTNSV